MTSARSCSSLVRLHKGVLVPWDCKEKENYLKGMPKHLVKKKEDMEALMLAVEEAEVCHDDDDEALALCVVVCVWLSGSASFD